MEIINYNYNVVKKDLLRAINVLKTSNNIDKIISAFIGLSTFHEEIFSNPQLKDILCSYLKNIEGNKFMLYMRAIREKNELSSQHIDKSKYYKIFKGLVELLEKSIKLFYTANNYTPFNDSSIYYIIEYYLKNYDPKLLKLFNKYIEKGQIFEICTPSFYCGCTLYIPFFDNVYIKMARYNNFKDIQTLIHEMSHAKVFEEILKKESDKKSNKTMYDNFYVEIYPRLQERYFMQFLIDNYLCIDDVKIYFVKYLKIMYALLVKNIKSYEKSKEFIISDISNINAFLYRDLLFLNNFPIHDLPSLKQTVEEEFYLSNFNEHDILNAIKENNDKIKNLFL